MSEAGRRPREHAIDLLRGLFILSMALSHFGSPLARWLNFRMLGFVTGAQGFVFVSGYVSGMVYGGLLRRQGAQALRTKVFARLRRLVFHVWLLVTFSAALAAVLGARSGLEGSDWAPMLDHPFLGWLGGLLLVYQPPLLDILEMYVVFLALLPAALGLLAAGRTRRFLALVLGVYAIGQVLSVSRFLPDAHVILGDWNIAGWQVLFFLGVMFGSPFGKPSLDRLRGPLGRWLALGAGAALFFMAHPRWIPGIPQAWILALQGLDSTWAEKMAMAPLSVLNFLVLALLYSMLHPWARTKVREGNPVARLGTKSLEIFTFHLFLLLLLRPIRQHLPAVADWPILALFMGALWAPVWFAARRKAAKATG